MIKVVIVIALFLWIVYVLLQECYENRKKF